MCLNYAFAGSTPFYGRQVSSTNTGQCRLHTAPVHLCARRNLRRARAMTMIEEGDPSKPVVESPTAQDTEVPVSTSPSKTALENEDVVSPTESESEPEPEPEPVDSDYDEGVPGKIQLDELALARQKAALEQYTMELRQKQIEEEREAARIFGFVPFAETLNGRLAMFFIITGLLTEYWTGYTIPEQVELLLRTLGFF